MFGGKDKEQKGSAVKSPVSNKTTLIAAGTKIIGDVNFSGNLELEGEVVGCIKAMDDSSKVRIVDRGRLEGNLDAPHIVINGQVQGNVYASKFIELAVNAHVEGDLYYRELETAKGSRINGRLIFSEKGKEKTQAKEPFADANKDSLQQKIHDSAHKQA